jgi:hypothetical protein
LELLNLLLLLLLLLLLGLLLCLLLLLQFFNGADVVGVGVGVNVVVFNVADAMLQYSQQIKVTWNC